jgi:GNAT superfamily N-acetyltransferase
MNDPKITLAWNPDKDIPFMEKEGMIHDTCISYAMGVDKSIFELENRGFIIKEDDGDYCVTFEYNQHDVWENYIRTHIKDTYWNEYIRLMNIDIVFLIKENNKVKRVTNHNYANNPELLATCNRLCEGDFKSIKELIFSNNFYKKNLEGRKPQADVFYRELKKALKETPVQESVTEDLMSLLPKDLQEWLKKGDFSKLEKDDSYYYIEGHPVEEFWRDPEFARSAFYLDDKNDPSYNSIVFSDDNGNGLIYDPTDGWYYYLYHDWTEDDTGFLHRERLSSKSWSTIVDPTHIKNFKDQQEKSRIASEELRNLKSNQIYSDISQASNKYFGKGIFKSDLKEVLSRWYKMGLDWCNDVIDFAEKYDFPKLKEAIEYFENHSIPEFSPSVADAHSWNVEAYREGAAKVVAAFNDVEDKLRSTPIQESALPDGVFLRPATLKDVPTMRDWQLESINARLRKRPDMFEYMEKDARESVPDTKMIMSGDRTIGMLQCCWIDDGEWWYIGEIYLIAEFRGRGIGSTLLLNEISEHDKLRLQVATDNPRAKALYESLGFKTVRMNQDMEVMDLVKTPESVCENMVEQLNSFKYGLGSNGSVHSASSKEYDEKYRLESPEEFEENGGGICYDYVEFMDKYLKEYGYHCRKFYISTDTEDNDTHTFILVNDDKGGYVYPESAFKLLEGIHHVKSPEDAALKVMDKVFDINDNGKKYDEIKYYVWEYQGHPPYGSTMEECGKYFTKGEPFHEGTAKKIK